MDLARKGKTIFFSSHNLYEIEQICSHIGIIYNGMVLKSGSIEDLRREISKPTVEIELKDAKKIKKDDLTAFTELCKIEGNKIVATINKEDDIPALVRWLSDQKFEITQVNRKILSVEELYLKFVDEVKR